MGDNYVQPVHPRGCGEHFKITATISGVAGSSPRVRGTRLGIITRRQLIRFIPAGAGNTLHLSPFQTARRFIPAGAGNTSNAEIEPKKLTVHPRGCGEHSFIIFSDE